MSAFLGPIHYWLYNKILLQEELTRDIAELALQNNWISENNYSYADGRPLEEIIDTQNIHGWLQERIHSAESRYAELVTLLLKDNDFLEQLKKTAFDFGKNHHVSENASPVDAYRIYNDSFVNGMPCDGVNKVTEQENDNVLWEETIDVHSSYWETVGGNVENYYILRAEAFKGMLDKTELAFSELSPKHYIIGR